MNIWHEFFKKPKSEKSPYKVEPRGDRDEHEDCFTQSFGCMSYDEECFKLLKIKEALELAKKRK